MTIEDTSNTADTDRTLARKLLNALKAAASTAQRVDDGADSLHVEIQNLAGSGEPLPAQPPRRSFLPKGIAQG
jgi:hypothetical protein